MKLPIYFHVGCEKTGSTAAQREFARSRRKLMRNGLYYPGTGLKHPFLRYMGRYLAGRPEREDQHEQSLDSYLKTVQQLEGVKEGVALLSEETVSRLGIEELAGALAAIKEITDDVQCLVYVRHPLSHVVSQAGQNMKGRRATLEQLHRHVPIYPMQKTLTNLINVFGRDGIIVRPYDKNLLSQGSIQNDILDAVGYTGSRAFIEGIRSNEALSLPAAMVLSATNERESSQCGREERRAQRARVKQLLEIPGSKFTLPAAAFQETREKTASELVWLRTEFGIELPEPEVVPLEDVDPEITQEQARDISYEMFPAL